jgi:hypothetical protein
MFGLLPYKLVMLRLLLEGKARQHNKQRQSHNKDGRGAKHALMEVTQMASILIVKMDPHPTRTVVAQMGLPQFSRQITANATMEASRKLQAQAR